MPACASTTNRQGWVLSPGRCLPGGGEEGLKCPSVHLASPYPAPDPSAHRLVPEFRAAKNLASCILGLHFMIDRTGNEEDLKNIRFKPPTTAQVFRP